MAIARAVVNRPALLVADEPTANLDAESAARILNIFVAFNQVGVTVLIASHDRGSSRATASGSCAWRTDAGSATRRREGMSAWLRQHRRALASAAARFAKLAGVLGALVIGVALALPVGGYALLEGLRQVAARLTLRAAGFGVPAPRGEAHGG